MAQVKNNIITEGLRGMLGYGVVFRRIGEKTFASARPKPTEKAPSEAQLAQRQHFREAMAYANTQKHNPEAWQVYTAIARKENSNPCAIAVKDYMNRLQLLTAPPKP